RFESVAELAQELLPIASPDDQGRVRRIVQTMRRAKGATPLPTADSTLDSVQAHSAAGTPASVVATAQGWTQARAENDRRGLGRPVLALRVVLGAGGVWLARRATHPPDTSVAEPEIHSAAAPSDPVLATGSAKPTSEPTTIATAAPPPRATPVLPTAEP